MSEDLHCKWNFNEKRKSSMGQGKEDSSFAPFVNKQIRCLVREYIQNSTDAHIDLSKKPVRVEFVFGTLKCSDYPQLVGSLLGRLKACSEKCQKYPNSDDPYENKVQYLTSHINGEIGYLKVADYNTTGMYYVDDEDEPSPFSSCVRENCASFKKKRFSGGSHGQGKTVGHVCSGLNAVYYSTKDEDNNNYGEGVIKLCDHKYSEDGENAITYEATAFYDSNNGERPDSGDQIPLEFRRYEIGTDVYVLGIEKDENNIRVMKVELLRSFFKAIAEGGLEVVIDGEEFNKGNIKERLDCYYPIDKFTEYDGERTRYPEFVFNPRPYCLESIMKCGQDDDHIIIDTEDFPGQFDILGHAKLYVWKNESIKESGSRDSVVYMRNNEMVIEVKRGSSNKGYYGVFLCDGEGDGIGSVVLRSMENVTHDKWDPNELHSASEEEKKIADKVKNAVKNFIKACETKMFPESNEDEHRLKSLKRRKIGILGDNRQDDEEDSADWPSTNINDEVKSNHKKFSGDSSIKVRTKKKKKNESKSGNETNGQPSGESNNQGGIFGIDGTGGPGDNGGYGEGGSWSGPGGEGGQIETGGGERTTITPDYNGQGSGSDGNGETDANIEGGKHSREIKLSNANKLLRPCRDGEYALILGITVQRDYLDCSINLMVQGESGLVPLEIKGVGDGYKVSGVDNNVISGFNLHKGINCIKFTPKEIVIIYSLKITAHGH